MKILVACEYSGTVTSAFRQLGHDVTSCDLLPSEIDGNHYQGNVLDILYNQWDMLIAFPPCTYLSYAGIAHWNKPARAEKRDNAFAFFMQMINAPIPRICVENPVGLPNKLYRKPNQIIHPYYFGHARMKRTCLWLKGLPHLWYWQDENSLFPITSCDKPLPITHDSTTGKARHWVDTTRNQKERSRLSPAIAAAMAIQWSKSS